MRLGMALAVLAAGWAPFMAGTVALAYRSRGKVLAQRSGLAARRGAGARATTWLVLAALATSFGPTEERFIRGGTSADIASGTGRTGLWHDLPKARVPQVPLVGASDLDSYSEDAFEHEGHAWNNAHDTYPFVSVSTGLPGLLCTVLIVGWPLAASFQRALFTTGPASPVPRLTRALRGPQITHPVR